MYLVGGTSLLVPLVGVVTAPILAQALGVAGRGEVAAALAPNSLVVSVATLGLPEALTYSLARDATLTRRALLLTSAASAAIGVLCLAVCAVFASVLAGGDAELGGLITIGVALAVPTLFVNLLRGAAAGLQKWRLIAVEKATNSALRLLVLTFLAVSGNLTVFAAILVVGIGPIAAAVAYWRIIVDITHKSVAARTRCAQPIFGYGSRIWMGSVASMVNGRISQLVITPLADVRQLGLFVVAITISDVPLILMGSIRDVVFGLNSRETDFNRLAEVSRLTLIIGGLVSLALGLALPIMVPTLFGHEFIASINPTIVLLVAGFVGIPGLIAGAGLGAWGRPGLRSMIVIAGLGVNATLLMLLVPSAGAMGAAVAGVAGSVVGSSVGVVAMARVAGAKVRDLVVPRPQDFATLSASVRRQLGRRGAVEAAGRGEGSA